MRSHLLGRTARISQIILCLALCSSLCTGKENAGSPAVSSSLDLEIYGYLKLDAAYDTARTTPGEFVKWVDRAPENADDDAFSMTVNQSRFGLKIGGKQDGEGEEAPRLTTSGRVEVDFYGGGAANKSRLMLRHAFIEVFWRESGVKLLAGQTSDLISPLVPYTLNYSVAWWGGNIGYRRPQLRLSKPFEIDSLRTLEVAGALARTIGATNSDFTGNDAGADSGMPTLQTRVGLRLASGSAYGLSGHWGEEEYDISAAGEAATFDSWSLNLDVEQQLGSGIVLKAEAFTGTNLQTYLGAIGQGVNLARLEEIGSNGGWISLDIDPQWGWAYHLGVSVDDADDENLEVGGRSRNMSIFASGVRSFSQHLQMGGEISYWATEYKDEDEATAMRGQFSVIYRF
jgi:hypothetical protein